jgi:membrane-bound metal-dependent hydrolase YbcI (DUF457 family)
MYAGHFASALVLKTIKPPAPTWALVTACGLPDLLFGLLYALGIEGGVPDFEGSHRLYIPWSHSLLMTILIGLAFTAFFRRYGQAVMAVIFAGVMSHWVLDIMIHRPDMELWPYSPIKLGFYDQFGPVSGWAETAIVIIATTIYIMNARIAANYGRQWMAMAALMVAFWGLGYLGT